MVNEGVLLKKNDYLTTLKEWEYFHLLLQWFGEYCFISCQVSVGRLIHFPEQARFSDEERRRFFTQYNAMSVDFVLVSKKTSKVVCVIELDDLSHEREDRAARDKRLDQLFRMAGVPFIHVPVSEMATQPDVWGTRDSAVAVH